MNNKIFKPYNPAQSFLLPPSMSDWLPKNHLAYFIMDVVSSLDLSAFYESYNNPRGGPPFDPSMMLNILMYCFCKGVRSSRKIEEALHSDIALRVLSGDQQPDHWTISNFRRRHSEAISGLFLQILKMAQKAGLVKMGHVAIDGTKLKANASIHRAMSYGRMKEEEKRLQKIVEQYLKECEEIDRIEDELYGDKCGDELPPDLADPQKRLKKIREAMKELEEEARQAADEDDEEARPPDKAQRNFTDPESRVMMDSSKAFIQGYNGQVAVDTKNQIIVGADLSDQAVDRRLLLPMVEQVVQNTGEKPQEISADAGYWSKTNITTLEENSYDVYIPPDKVRHREWRECNPPRVGPSSEGRLTERMRSKLRTERGRERYKQRHTTVEPVIGQVKECRGLRQFLLRGLDLNRAMWRFECAMHNLLKMFRLEVNLEALGSTG